MEIAKEIRIKSGICQTDLILVATQLRFHNPGVDSCSLTYREKDNPRHHPRIHDRVCYGTATTLLI